MGLFDDLAGQAAKMAGGNLGNLGGLGDLANAANHPLLGQLQQWVQQLPGGLPGLLATAQQQGLGAVVQSWIGTGANLPISAAQVTQLLGQPQVQALASQFGLSPDLVQQGLSALLPHAVDQLTPNGQLPAGQ